MEVIEHKVLPDSWLCFAHLDMSFDKIMYLIRCQCSDNRDFCDIFYFPFCQVCWLVCDIRINLSYVFLVNDSCPSICVVWGRTNDTVASTLIEAQSPDRVIPAEHQNKQIKLKILTYMAFLLLKTTNLIIHFLDLALLTIMFHSA